MSRLPQLFGWLFLQAIVSLVWVFLPMASATEKRPVAEPTRRQCIKQLTKLCPAPDKRERMTTTTMSQRLECFEAKLKELPGCQPLVKKFLARYEKRVRVKPLAAARSRGMALFLAGLLLVLGLGSMAVMPAILVKAGYERGLGFIPGYNLYLLYRIAGVPWWWAFASLTPAVVYFWPKTCLALAESFGQDRRLGFSMALLPFLYLPILAYSRSIHYEGRGALPDIRFDVKL